MLTVGKATRSQDKNESVEGEGRLLSMKTKLTERLFRKIRASTHIPLACDSAPVQSELSSFICHRRNLERTSSSSTKSAKGRWAILFLVLAKQQSLPGESISRPITAACLHVQIVFDDWSGEQWGWKKKKKPNSRWSKSHQILAFVWIALFPCGRFAFLITPYLG